MTVVGIQRRHDAFQSQYGQEISVGLWDLFWTKRMSRTHKEERQLGSSGIRNGVHTFVHVYIDNDRKPKERENTVPCGIQLES